MSGFLNTYKFFPVYSYQDGALQWLIKSLSFILFFENLDMYLVHIFIFKLPDVVQSSEEPNKTDIKRTSRVRQLKTLTSTAINQPYDQNVTQKVKPRNGENLI